jgi:hypothetical protein
MLARQQRGRHHDGHLLAVHGGDEGGAQRHLRLAEANVAADEPVHGAALLQVVDDGIDGGELVFRLLIGEAGGEFLVGAFGRRQHVAGLQLARGGRADQAFGDLEDALLELGLLGLPGAAAQPVELCALLVRAIAREKLDVLDGQEQPVAAGIGEEQAVMRGPLHLDGLQPLEAADAMVHVHDEIAGCERRKLADEVRGLLVAPAPAHHAVAQNVLLGDDGEIIRLEAFLEAQHQKARDGLVPGEEFRPVPGGGKGATS